jgi:hypothetical protein
VSENPSTKRIPRVGPFISDTTLAQDYLLGRLGNISLGPILMLLIVFHKTIFYFFIYFISEE